LTPTPRRSFDPACARFLEKLFNDFYGKLILGISEKRKPKQKPIVLTKRRFCFDSDAAPIVRSGMRQIS
jgi:hypothetical protein